MSSEVNIPKRILYCSKKDLFFKFKTHHPEISIGHTSFSKTIPNEVIIATSSRRLTCGYAKCINLSLMAKGIQKHASNIWTDFSYITCHESFSHCLTCMQKLKRFCDDCDDNDSIITYESIITDKQLKQVSITKVSTSKSELLDKICSPFSNQFVRHKVLIPH